MYQYHCLNPISQIGLDKFTENYQKTEAAEAADAILVRSASMHEMELPENLKVVARAGAGVNNIPLSLCGERDRSIQYTRSQCKWCERTRNCRNASGSP